MHSASRYLDDTAQSAHWTVYSMARSKAELKIQLVVNSAFYLSMLFISVGVGFFCTGILDLISSNLRSNYGVNLWGGALFAIAVGGLLVYFYVSQSKDASSKVVGILLGVVIAALVMHVVTASICAVSANRQFIDFQNKLVNACDPDPNSYVLGGQQGSSGVNYNPNNPNYIPNCSPGNVQCNTDPYLYAINNPATWWSANKDAVFKLETFYRSNFRFSYISDVCGLVMALQLIAAEIGLIIGLKYMSSHLDEAMVDKYETAPLPQPPQQAEQKVISYLNASTNAAPPAVVPPASKPVIKPVEEPQTNGEQMIYANVSVSTAASKPVEEARPPPSVANIGSRSTINTTGNSVAGLSVTSRSSRAPKGAIQTRAMLAEEAPPQTLPLKRLNAPTSTANVAAPVPMRVGASASSRTSAVPARHTMNKK